MTETGWVFRVEITSSTIIYTDEMKERLRGLLESDVEIERFRIDELYESLKVFSGEFDVEELRGLQGSASE